jgi:hypothetical protein
LAQVTDPAHASMPVFTIDNPKPAPPLDLSRAVAGRLLPDMFQYLKSIHARQHDIQNDGPVVP